MSTDQTTNLGLPFLMPAQAQKHVTVNESLARLDALAQLAVESRSLAAEPASPADGAVWILPPGKTGTAWGGYADGALAYYRDGAWEALAPKPGWRALVKDEGALVFWTGTAWGALAPALAGLRNAVINGCFRVWQRGTSFTDASGFTADRWYTNRGGGAAGLTVSRQPGPPGHRYAMRLQRASGNADAAGLAAYYTLETSDSVRFQGERATLSFLARCGAGFSPAGGGVSVTVRYGAGTDQRVYNFTGSTIAASATVGLTTSWQVFMLTSAGVLPGSASGVGMELNCAPTGTAGTDDWLEIAGVQLEPSEAATPFERRAIDMEQRLCERYFEKSYAQTVAPGTTNPAGQVDFRANGALHRQFVSLRTTKRTLPTVTLYNPNSGAVGSWRDNTASLDRSTTAQNVGDGGFGVALNASADGNVVFGHWTAEAEL